MTRKFLTLFIVASIAVSLVAEAKDKIKIACVGNSVTYGQNLPDREHTCYPAQLQNLFGEDYDVRNFGRSSATLNPHGEMSYRGLPQYRDAISFKADIVVIHLGLNDTDPRWWPNYSEEFISDYRSLIDSFRIANPKAKVYICLMTPIGNSHWRFLSGTRDWHAQEQQAIRQVAATANVGLIDLFTPFYSHPELFPDALHPDPEGAQILAKTVFQNLTGNFGGLQMPMTYTDNMVLQRDKQLTISGIANAGEKVEVRLGNVATQKATTSAQGKWSVTLPAQKAGGPYTLKIKTSNKTLKYNNVWMGDVWLCSGQSNMAFTLAQSVTAQKDFAEAPLQTNIHVLDMQPMDQTYGTKWSENTLNAINRQQYMLNNGWKTMDKANTSTLSAVAYHFGKTLADSLKDIHIGLICNAVGGTPLESWVDRWTLEYDYPNILFNWLKNDHIQGWCRERAALNIANSTNKLQRHPYEPCTMFENGIMSLGHPAIKGVIWYQGESNAHNTELHERLFPLLLKSWRQWFDDKEMPFYFVQLSSLNRPSWPRFRNGQRKLANSQPNVWMAVTTDIGDSLDVHPKQKQQVGQRLALQALCHTYNHPILLPQGPEPKGMKIEKDEIVVSFDYASNLHGKDSKPIIGFEIAGNDGLYYNAQAKVEGNTIRLSSKEVKTPVAVRYAWQPFTRANLVNDAELPTTTFEYKPDYGYTTPWYKVEE